MTRLALVRNTVCNMQIYKTETATFSSTSLCEIFLTVNVAWWLLTRVVGSASKRASRAVVVAVPGATVRWAHRKIINTINSLNSGAAPSQLHPTCGHNCTAPAASHTCHATHVSRITLRLSFSIIRKLSNLESLFILVNKYLFTLLIQLSIVFYGLLKTVIYLCHSIWIL